MFSVQNFKRHFVSEYPIRKNRKDSKWSLYVLSDLSRNIGTFLLSMPSTEFWTKFENFWLTVTRRQIKLDYINIILGILDQRSNLLNYFIILGKLYLWNCRKNKQVPLFLPFEDVVKRKYEIEKLIASQSILNLKYFHAEWNLVLNNNPILL